MHDLDRSDLVFEINEDELDVEELEAAEDDEAGALPDDDGRAFGEVEERELATQLLATESDHELDQFLDSVIRRVRKLRRLKPALATSVGGYLKGAVKKALPTVAGMAGAALGGPAGALLASQGAPYLSGMLGLELEGLSPEDAELETAKQLVRMAGAAVANAASAADGSPATVARQAVIDAARRFAPGLVRPAGAASPRAQQGTWYRKGNTIVLVGV